jgi:alpha-L-rhamnosidase
MNSTWFGQHQRTALACIIAIGTSIPAVAQRALCAVHLTTEDQAAPMAIDLSHPRLSWKIETNMDAVLQTGYRVVVATTAKLASTGNGDVWDSGEVASADSINVFYGGRPLEAATRYYWAVRVRDNQHHTSAWSAPGWWEMGLLKPKDWSAAQWIAGAPGKASPLLRSSLEVTKPVAQARLSIAAAGYYVASINGHRVGDAVLDPGFTDFHERNLYRTYDVRRQLRQGLNAIGVVLGRGFYAIDATKLKWWNRLPWLSDSPALLAKLDVTYADGSHAILISDSTWKTHDGPTQSDSMFYGESYDARKVQKGWDTPAFDLAAWKPVRSVRPPSQIVQAEGDEPIRLVKTWQADTISQPKPGVYVYKFPIMIAGWTRLTVSGAAGTTVTMRLGESLRPDGTVETLGDPNMSPGEIQKFDYTLAGAGLQTWSPEFSYAGFQYAQVEGYPGTPNKTSVEAQEVHSDVPSIGSFTSSNPLLEQIHAICRQSVVNNLYSIPTDTPLYEKRGWGGDALLFSAQAADNFDVLRFFTKWMYDVADSQDDQGNISTIAPGLHAGADPAWGSVIIFLPWRLYQEYGDLRPIEQHYEAMKRYMQYLDSKADNHIVDGSFGDWVSPNRTGVPRPPEGAKLVATAVYFRDAELMAKMAALLSRSEDQAAFTSLSAAIRKSFNANFLDTKTAEYHTEKDVGYRQTSNVVPLDFNMAPDDETSSVLARLKLDIKDHDDHLNTGAFGTAALLPALTLNGQIEMAYAVATQTTYPSWGFWISRGATTTLERWDPDKTRSRDHAFLGTVDDWFYKYLAGIKPGKPGYKEIEIRPYIPAELGHVAASIDTPYGLVSSSWTRQANGQVDLDVVIPANATAHVWVPGADMPVSAGSGKHHYNSSDAKRPAH